MSGLPSHSQQSMDQKCGLISRRQKSRVLLCSLALSRHTDQCVMLDYLFSVGHDFSEDVLDGIVLHMSNRNQAEELDKLPYVIGEWKGALAAREAKELALIEAIRRGHLSTVKYLTRDDPEVLFDMGYIYSAVRSDDPATLEYVLSVQTELSEENRESLVHQAVLHEKTKSLEVLLALFHTSPDRLEEEYERTKDSITDPSIVDVLLKAGLRWNDKREYKKWLRVGDQAKGATAAGVQSTYEELLKVQSDEAYLRLASHLHHKNKKTALEVLAFMKDELTLLC